MAFHQKVKGFTLTELMVTLAIMAIMAAIAMPNLSTFTAKTRINNRAEQIANLFRYARSEAIRMNVPVVICGDTIRSDGRPSGACGTSIAVSTGLKAFADADKNGVYSSTSTPKDIDLRTITINGNADKKDMDIELIYRDINGKEVAGVSEPIVFYPDGKFGVSSSDSDTKLGQRSIGLSRYYVRFTLKDMKKSSNSFYRDVVISPSGNVKVCTHKESDELCTND